MLIFVVILIWIMFEMIYLLTHRKPLNKVQMQKLSHKRTKRYIKKQFKFSARNVYVDKQFKSTLKPNGRLYNMNHSLMLFPAYVATLLKGKKHEWVVLALADDTRVRFMWVNKGLDSQHVAFSCEFDELINICKTYHCHTVLCFHNHPNSNPYAQSLLLASEQDMVSAESCSRIMSVHGINWIDFVCERGNYIKYFSNFSPLFCPECAKIENIQRENGISVMRNYKLHRELRLLH